MAFGLRFDFALPDRQLRLLAFTLPIVVALRAGAFAVFRLYEGIWRYVSVRDVFEMAKAVTASSALFALGALLLGLRGMPRSVLVLDWILCLGASGGLRIAARMVLERRPASRRRGDRAPACARGRGR